MYCEKNYEKKAGDKHRERKNMKAYNCRDL